MFEIQNGVGKPPNLVIGYLRRAVEQLEYVTSWANTLVTTPQSEQPRAALKPAYILSHTDE